MSLTKAQKNEQATEYAGKFSEAGLIVFAGYKGLKSNNANALRKSLRQTGANVQVVKNNVARLAAQRSRMSDSAKSLVDGLVGPSLVAYTSGDVASVAKSLSKFAKENPTVEIRGGVLEGRAVSAADVQALADLPSREVLLAMLLGVMNGPIRNFAGVLAAVPRGLVTVLSAIEKKKSE